MWHVWHVWMVKWSRHIGARFEQQGDALGAVVPCGDLWQEMHRDMHGRFSSLAVVAERVWRHSEQILQTCNPFSFASCTGTVGLSFVDYPSSFICCSARKSTMVCVCVAWKMTRIDKICARSPILSHQYAPLGTLLRSFKSVAISAVGFRSSASWRAARCCKSP